MEITFRNNQINDYVTGIDLEIFDGRENIAHGYIATHSSRYHSQWIPTLTVGGIGTEPEYRREGLVRKIMDAAFKKGADYGALVSLLHPFSFSYYRKFGYEKVSDHLILEFPIDALEHLPRVNDFVKLVGPERVPDVLRVYEHFSQGRNLILRRFGCENFPLEPSLSKKVTYIRYRGNEPVAYVTLNSEKTFFVNRNKSINLNVWEIAFTDSEALRDIFGFLRMFEGENDTVKIHNCSMIPEVDMLLRQYARISYTIVPDVMARILDTAGLLAANDFPEESGSFRLTVEDSLPAVRGVFEVEYQHGKSQVTRLAEDPDTFTVKTDVSCTAPALAQILYGYHSLTPQLFPYLDGVKVTGDISDLIRAYPKAINGVFEHF